MDVVKQGDVDKLFDALVRESIIEPPHIDEEVDRAEFHEVVQEVFGIFDDTNDQTLDEMCSQITDENKPELLV